MSNRRERRQAERDLSASLYVQGKGHRTGPVYYRLHCSPIERANNGALIPGSRVGLWFGVFGEIKKGPHAEALSNFI